MPFDLSTGQIKKKPPSYKSCIEINSCMSFNAFNLIVNHQKANNKRIGRAEYVWIVKMKSNFEQINLICIANIEIEYKLFIFPREITP